MQKLFDFLNKLDEMNLAYAVEHNRNEAVMILIAVPGQRWEVEFFADDHVEVEVFESTGGVEGEERLKELFEKYS